MDVTTANSAYGPEMVAGLMAMFGVLLLVGLVFYIYFALTMMKTADRLKEKNSWLAWIPIANLVLLARMAKMPAWPVLLIIGSIIPFIGIIFSLAFMVFTVVWTWKVCERRNRDGWWAVLTVIPIVGMFWTPIMWGILAWSKK